MALALALPLALTLEPTPPLALAARDGTALADVLKRHLSNKCETVKSHLESENAES